MTISKITPLEPIGIKLTRRSFLGWTAKLGIVAVTTKIVPASLDDLEVIKCNMTASEIVYSTDVAERIRAHLWSKALQEALLDQLGKLYEDIRNI